MRSRISYILCSLLLLYTTFIFYPKWEKPAGESPLGWDASGYYWYLPSIFIYHDLKHQQFSDSILHKYQFTPENQQSWAYNNGNRVLVYSSGMAVMFSPFFAIAQAVAKRLGYPADGFSLPYQISLQLGGLLIALIGIWYFRKLLLIYYSDTVTAIMLLLLVYGSNYLNYTGISSTLTHCWLFTVYVFIILNTVYFYRQPSYKYAVRIGLLIGLAILTRPTEAIAILIPLLWGVESLSINSLKERFLFLRSQLKKIAITTLCIIAVGSIQIVYWLYITGKPFVYSYKDKGFSWLHPHLWDYMCSYRSGWITYTPLVIFFFLGIIPFLKHGKNKVAVLTFFALNLYIVSAWDIWWYGGTGGRAMIQSYPVIMFPMATLIDEIIKRKILLLAFAPFLLLAVYINIWFTYNAHKGEGLYDPEGMNCDFYWAVIGRWHVNPLVQRYKDTHDVFFGTPKNLKLIYSNDFENDTTISTKLAAPISNNKSIASDKDYEYSPSYYFPFSKTPGVTKTEWLRASGLFKFEKYIAFWWDMPEFTVQFMDNHEIVQTNTIRPTRTTLLYEPKEFYFDVKVPASDIDSVRFFTRNASNDVPFIMDNIRFYSFNE